MTECERADAVPLADDFSAAQAFAGQRVAHHGLLDDLRGIATGSAKGSFARDETEIHQIVFDQRQAAIALREKIKLDLFIDAFNIGEMRFQAVEPRAAYAGAALIAVDHQTRIAPRCVND